MNRDRARPGIASSQINAVAQLRTGAISAADIASQSAPVVDRYSLASGAARISVPERRVQHVVM